MSASQKGTMAKKGMPSHKGSKKNKKTGKLKLPGAGMPEPPEGSIYSTPGGAQKTIGQKPVSSGSLLEEVLNEKKIAMLKSPEVMKFLQDMQVQVAVEKADAVANQPVMEVPRGRRRYASGEPRLSTLTESRPRHASHGALSEPQAQHAHTSMSTHTHTSVGEPRTQDVSPMLDSPQATPTNPQQTYQPSNPADASKVIWSKDASAFTSVASGNDPAS